MQFLLLQKLATTLLKIISPVNEITFTLTAGSHWFHVYPWLASFQKYVISFANLQLLSRHLTLSFAVAARKCNHKGNRR